LDILFWTRKRLGRRDEDICKNDTEFFVLFFGQDNITNLYKTLNDDGDDDEWENNSTEFNWKRQLDILFNSQ